MAIVLDTTTRGEYLAQTLASARASLIVSALPAPVVCEVYDGQDVLRASGTMQAPWATASGATVTVGEVTAQGIDVTSGGAPDSNWYCQFRSGSRFLRGTFGVLGSGRDFVWSLASFQTGSRGTLGTVAMSSTGGADGGTGPTVAVTTFTVTSATTGTLPWAFGHAFKQGDVPSGQSVVTTDSMDFQATPTTFWPDGSVRHAIIAGRTTFAAPGTMTVNIGRGTAPTGATLTTADLNAVIPASTSVSVGGTTMTLAGSFLNSPQRTVCTGPVMSNWIYRLQVAGTEAVIWCDVRLYKGGTVEVFPWLENGFLLSSSPALVNVSPVVTVAGASVYSQTFDLHPRSRIPLVTAAPFAYWHPSNPQITPKHNATYLMSTKLVPNYGWLSPTDATLNALTQTYSPYTTAGYPSSMPNYEAGSILPRAQVPYITSAGDARAYRAAIVFGMAGGSWQTHYRDAATNEPFRYATWPSLSTNTGGSPSMVKSSRSGWNPIPTHQPSFGYLPWLMTGRWWFLDETLFWAGANYLEASPTQRQQARGIIDGANGTYANRGGAWALWSVASALSILPNGAGNEHPMLADLKYVWEQNCAFYRAKYVEGGTYNGVTYTSSWISPQGQITEYSSGGASLYNPPTPTGAFWGSAWMSNYYCQAFGHASNIGLPVSAQAGSDLLVVRDHAYKNPISRTGGDFDYKRFSIYAYPIGADQTGVPPETWYTAAQSYADYLAGYSLTDLKDAAGDTALRVHLVNTVASESSSGMTSYFPQQLSSLALAVEHGAPGAQAGWTKITNASNFVTVTQNNMRTHPEHSFWPRTALPTWLEIAPLFAWTEVPNSVISASPVFQPGATSDGNGFFAFSGGTLKESGSELIEFGGGHSDYWGNDGYAIRLQDNAPAWRRLCDRTPLAQVTQDVAYNVSDGRPTSRHTYHFIHHIAAFDTVVFPVCANVWFNTPSFAVTDGFSMASGTYFPAGTYASPPAPILNSLGGNGCVKTPTGTIYIHGGNGNFYRWVPTAGSPNGAPGVWTDMGNKSSWVNEEPFLFDPGRNIIVRLGNTNNGRTAGIYDLNNNATFSGFTLSGDATAISEVRGAQNGQGRGSFIYDSVNDCYWFWRRIFSTQTPKLYKIVPSGSRPLFTFTVSEQAFSGTVTNDSSAFSNGYGRFAYCPELRGIVWHQRRDAPVRFLRTA
jgi:hypothetical protein